jgi:hypothetical protein
MMIRIDDGRVGRLLTGPFVTQSSTPTTTPRAAQDRDSAVRGHETRSLTSAAVEVGAVCFWPRSRSIWPHSMIG